MRLVRLVGSWYAWPDNRGVKKGIPRVGKEKWFDGGVAAALGAALLFEAGTPLAKLLLASVGPWMLAGSVNLALALAVGDQVTGGAAVAAAMAVGFLAYGVSLALFVVGLLTAGLLMGAGVWLHLTEKHEHTHAHYPDAHHRHSN